MTKPSIYKQHDAAFQHVSAYVIAKDGARVATIAFKYPRDSAGRLYAYVHWLGAEMVRGFAGGCGYDKQSAACSHAASRLEGRRHPLPSDSPEVVWSEPDPMTPDHLAFKNALLPDDGHHWDGCLRDAGFEVWQAV